MNWANLSKNILGKMETPCEYIIRTREGLSGLKSSCGMEKLLEKLEWAFSCVTRVH